MVHEVDEELREIKREIIESRGLVIKTNNLTNALSADIKSIAKRQQGYQEGARKVFVDHGVKLTRAESPGEYPRIVRSRKASAGVPTLANPFSSSCR